MLGEGNLYYDTICRSSPPSETKLQDEVGLVVEQGSFEVEGMEARKNSECSRV